MFSRFRLLIGFSGDICGQKCSQTGDFLKAWEKNTNILVIILNQIRWLNNLFYIVLEI